MTNNIMALAEAYATAVNERTLVGRVRSRAALLAEVERVCKGEWIRSTDALPDIPEDARKSEDVLGGHWVTDDWLRDGHPDKRRFSFGPCFVMESDDLEEFPQGKRWHTFGPSHNQITHWRRVKPPSDAGEPS